MHRPRCALPRLAWRQLVTYAARTSTVRGGLGLDARSSWSFKMQSRRAASGVARWTSKIRPFQWIVRVYVFMWTV